MTSIGATMTASPLVNDSFTRDGPLVIGASPTLHQGSDHVHACVRGPPFQPETYLLGCQQVPTMPPMSSAPIEPRRSQAERRSASEGSLLDAAAELIAEQGIDRASFPKIGDRAGASRGLPTHYFGSKDAMVDRLARRTQERIQDLVVRADDPAPALGSSGLARIRRIMANFLQQFVDATPEARALIVLWGATFPSESSLPAMADADRRTHEGWITMVEAGQADGSIRTDLDPAATAAALLALSRGFAALLLSNPGLIGITDIQATCDMWIEAVLENDRDR